MLRIKPQDRLSNKLPVPASLTKCSKNVFESITQTAAQLILSVPWLLTFDPGKKTRQA